MSTVQTSSTIKKIGIARIQVFAYNKPLKQLGSLLFECDNYADVEDELYKLSIHSIGRGFISNSTLHIHYEAGEPMVPLRFVFSFKNGREQTFTSMMNTQGVFHDDKTFGEILIGWIIKSSKLNPCDSSFANLNRLDALDLLKHYELPTADLGG